MKNAQLTKYEARFRIERLIREILWSWHFIETRTPLLVQSPGMEPHICPIEVKSRDASLPVFLPTSPEFGMKKLLAQGMDRIFQICSSFRDEPNSPEHHPEFTMLEIYETGISLDDFQSRMENLIRTLCENLHGTSSCAFRGMEVDFKSPWPRFRVVDLFQKHLGLDLRSHQASKDLHAVCMKNGIASSPTEDWNDLYFKLWLNLIEPKLPRAQPCFVTHYPVSQSSLCNRVTDEKGFEWANRFEMYLGTLELGNAFDELRDPALQRKNFEHDQKIRAETYGDRYPQSPIDESLLAAISCMKPTSGIAIGVDRLCMILLDARSIDEILPLKSFWPRSILP